MPKFEFNPRTGQMEIKKPTGIEFYKVGGGLKVTDHDLPASFIILRDTDEIGYANGRAATSVKIFDIRKSRMIADRVKRIMPNSKYTNYTYFCKGVKTLESLMSEEDTNLLESLLEQYGETAINESVSNIVDNMLNEGYGPSVADPKWSDNQTRGATDVGHKKRLRGLGGFVKTLPSMAISFLICPPLACIQLLGAVRHRMEKKWLKKLFNSKTWLDFIANPSEKQEELKQKMKDAFAEKTQYYYTTLANGEILKVPAVNTLEAKDMVLAITRKELIPRYTDLDSNKSHILKEVSDENGNVTDEPGISTGQGSYIADTIKYSDRKCKMWAVKFSDGQCCYMFGPEGQRDELKKKAQESKKGVIEYYKKVKLKGKTDDDNKDSKTLKHKGIGTDTKDGTEVLDEMFVYPTVDDMYEIKNTGMYKMITEENEKDFSTPTTGQPSPWQPLDYPIYTIHIGNDQNNQGHYAATLKLVASNADEAGKIAKRILEDDNMQDIIREEINTINLNDNEILQNVLGGIDSSTTPFQKMTFTIKVCGSEFTITCLDDGVYKPGSQKPEFTGRFSANTKNSNTYIFRSSLSSHVLSKITKAIESAYSSDDINKDVKSMYANRLAKVQGSMNEVDKTGTHPSNVFNINTVRDDVIIADWDAVDTASKTETKVKSCTKERPGGEVLAHNLTIKIAV